MEDYYIGSLTKCGARTRARRIFVNVMYRVNLVFNFSSYSEILSKIYELSAPLIDVKYKRKSGQNYPVPASISQRRSESVVARWVLQSARQRSDVFSIEDRLVNEMCDILRDKGLTLNRRFEFHKRVISNRFFMKSNFQDSKLKKNFSRASRFEIVIRGKSLPLTRVELYLRK